MKSSISRTVPADASPAAKLITRREAIRRATLFLGVAISPSLLTGALDAAAVPATAGLKPAYLSAKQMEAVSALAERILPRTDTPGAIDAGVPSFIDLMVGKYFTADERQLFLTGLAEIDAASVTAHRRPFAEVTGAQQDALLTELAAASAKKEKSFCHQIRELTIFGYFTSEKVGRNVLHYDPVPGRFDGCVPLSEVGNVNWFK